MIIKLRGRSSDVPASLEDVGQDERETFRGFDLINSHNGLISREKLRKIAKNLRGRRSRASARRTVGVV